MSFNKHEVRLYTTGIKLEIIPEIILLTRCGSLVYLPLAITNSH